MSASREDDVGAATTETRTTADPSAFGSAAAAEDDAGDLSSENPLTLQFPRRQFLANFASYAASAPLTSTILVRRRPDS